MTSFQNLISFWQKHYAVCILMFLFLFSFVALSPLLNAGFSYGDDNTPHYVFTVRLTEMLRNGNFHLWDPDANIGFAMLQYYQPLSYLFTSVLYLTLPWIDSLFLYKLLLILLFSLFPVCIYISCRLFGLSKEISLFSAFFSLTIHSSTSFGFEISSYLIYGLYSMLFGMLLLPITIAYCFRELMNSKRLFGPVLLLSLTFLFHTFVGIAAYFSVALLFFVRRKWSDFVYLFKIFLFSFLVISFWFIPLLLTLNYYGGHPFQPEEMLSGYGISNVLFFLFSAQLFDSLRLPFFTCFFFIGVFACLFSRKIEEHLSKQHSISPNVANYFLLNFCGFLLLLAGKKTFSFLFDFGLLQFSRFFSGIDLFGIFIAGVGASFVFSLLREKVVSFRENKQLVACLLVVFLTSAFLMLFLVSVFFLLHNHARTFSLQEQDPTYLDALSFLAKLPNARVHANGVTGIQTHFRLYTVPLYAKKPLSVSYAVGLQDALGFFYAESFKEPNPLFLDLFNERYLLSSNEKNYPYAELLYKNENYSVYQVNTSGYFALVHASNAFVLDNKKARPLIIEWSNSSLFAEKNFLLLLELNQISFFQNNSAVHIFSPEMLALSSPTEIISQLSKNSQDSNESPQNQSCGSILSEEINDTTYAGTFQTIDSSCFLMLKVNAHPYWHALVDGQEISWVQISPSFMAVPVSEGIHKIEFEYQIPRWRLGLFLFSCFILLFCVIYSKKPFPLLRS